MLVMGQIVYLFNCRYLSASVMSRAGLFGNRLILISVGVLLILQLAFTYLPWGRIIAVSLLLFLVIELEKFWLRRKAEQDG